jgi:hypothetical protein
MQSRGCLLHNQPARMGIRRPLMRLMLLDVFQQCVPSDCVQIHHELLQLDERFLSMGLWH